MKTIAIVIPCIAYTVDPITGAKGNPTEQTLTFKAENMPDDAGPEKACQALVLQLIATMGFASTILSSSNPDVTEPNK